MTPTTQLTEIEEKLRIILATGPSGWNQEPTAILAAGNAQAKAIYLGLLAVAEAIKNRQ